MHRAATNRRQVTDYTEISPTLRWLVELVDIVGFQSGLRGMALLIPQVRLRGVGATPRERGTQNPASSHTPYKDLENFTVS
jgi:hypothetical protein